MRKTQTITTATCDRCGEEIDPSDIPANLRVVGEMFDVSPKFVDLCKPCAGDFEHWIRDAADFVERS